MRLANILSISLVIFIFSSCVICIITVQGAEDNENIIDANFNIKMITATEFGITVEIIVERILAFDQIYTKSDINTMSLSTEYDDLIVMGSIMQTLHDLLKKQINVTFENAQVKYINSRPEYDNGSFFERFNLTLTNSFFKLNESIEIDEFLNGVLDIGAYAEYLFDLYAEPGWNNTYSLTFENNYFFKRTNGNVYDSTIEWDVRNWQGTQSSINAEITVINTDPSFEPKNEDIFIEFIIDSEYELTSLNAEVLVKTIKIDEFDILPDIITNLSSIPADAIRLFLKNNLLSLNETLYNNTLEPLELIIKKSIESQNFNQTLDFEFNWDKSTTTKAPNPYNITNMNDKPPIKAIYRDPEIQFNLYNIPNRAVFGLINSGGTANVTEEDINFGENIYSINYPYTISILMPENILLDNQNNYTWNETIPFIGNLTSKNPPEYQEEEIETEVNIIFTKTDLNLLSIFTGNTELTFGLNLEQKRNYNITEIPQEFNIPNKINIQYLNSDAIRLCIDENVFTDAEVSQFLLNENEDFIKNIQKILPNLKINGNINREAFENSLFWDKDISEMNSKSPLTTASYSHTTIPTRFEISILPPGVNIPIQRYTFSGVPNQTITYKMQFPNGLDLEVDDVYDKARVKTTNDGERYLTISFQPSESNLTVQVACKLIPSTMFVIGILMPCIISIFITLILIIVVIIIRRKRKGRRSKKIKPSSKPVEQDTNTDYEDEDFYVPPPPGSK